MIDFRRGNEVACASGSFFVRGLLLPLSRSEPVVPISGPRRRFRDVWFVVGDVELEGGNVRSLPTIALLLQACVDVQMLGAFGNSSHSWQGNRTSSAFKT